MAKKPNDQRHGAALIISQRHEAASAPLRYRRLRYRVAMVRAQAYVLGVDIRHTCRARYSRLLRLYTVLPDAAARLIL